MRRMPIKTHSGIVTDGAGDRLVKLHATATCWVVKQTECYYRDSGARVGGKGARLYLGSIKELYGDTRRE
ncbi:Phage protein [Sodalis praecaptivus]|uniref:Phage protein n=1 Tax=Sodalis praecaptivus TaxID=1239307 RepID=W0HZN4_9GAMM|nr:Phage protein [Sodalis praecaptivus]